MSKNCVDATIELADQYKSPLMLIASRRQSLAKCEQRLNAWMLENNHDSKKVKVMTALIYLNIAALHHYPYSLLLYGLGKKILKEELS